jgi:D-amino-acid dehydrogenase
MKVIVLGAGVIGVTSAYFLARAGHQVTVLEKNLGPALGCSHANGGQLSYSHVETWAAKSSALSIFKAAFTPNSFLSVSDFLDGNFLKWIREFYQNSSLEKSQENSRKLFAISSYSKEVLEEILKEENISFDYQNNGILHFYCNKEKMDDAVKDAEFYESIGCRAQILNAEECVKKEPTLIKLFDEKKLVGGIFYEADASGDSFKFTTSLEKICQEKYGVTFEYGVDVKNIFTNHKKITGINTDKGVYVANAYVYALGAFGNKLLRGIKVNSKIYPLKGYSLSITTNEEFVAPQMAMTDPTNKIVYSRIGNVFRIAGTAEACGLKPKINKKHIAFLKKIISASFSDFGNFNQVKEWFGFRPFRPNSIPLVCEVKKYQNLFLNTGHGSLGWTLSAASGKILSNLVSNNKNPKFEFLEKEGEEIY